MNYTQIFNKLKPLLVKLIKEVTGQASASSSSATSPGDTSVFLRTDGTRALTGDLAVDDGVLVDDVDISEFKDDFDVLAGHQVIAGAGLTGGGSLAPGDVTVAVGAGTGITVNANDVAVNQAFSPTWSGTHEHQQVLKTRGLQPQSATSDIGDSTHWYRTGYISELNSVVFAENAIILIGDRLMVCKGQGTLPAAVASGDTTINFGIAMTANDIVLLRAAGQVEWIKVLTLSAGTTYNVTRNLDGSGANTWAIDNPYAILGQSPNGYIELDASGTPRLSIKKMGSTWNDQTEVGRLGDMNGAFGVATESHGLGVGDYTAGNYMKYDVVGGFALKALKGNLSISEAGIVIGQPDFATTMEVKSNGGTRYTVGQLVHYGGSGRRTRLEAMAVAAPTEIGTNGTFETNTTGWTATSPATITRVTTTFYNGVASAKLNININGLVSTNIVGTAGSVTPGQFVRCAFRWKVGLLGTTIWTVKLIFKTAGAVTVSTISNILTDEDILTTDAWQRGVLESVVPATAATVTFQIDITGGVSLPPSAYDEYIYLDDVTISRYAQQPAYVEPYVPYPSGTPKVRLGPDVDIAGSAAITTGVNVGSASGAAAGEVRASDDIVAGAALGAGLSSLAPLATVHAQQQTIGNAVQILESIATNDDVAEYVYQARTTTSTNTAVNLWSMAVPSGTMLLVRAVVYGRRTGGSGTAQDAGAFEISALYQLVAGASGIIAPGPLQTVIGRSLAGYSATLDANGANARVRVVGPATTDITWHGTIRAYLLAT